MPRCSVFQPNATINSTTFPFELFVNQFLAGCNDPHWRPLYKRLSNRMWPYINFVGYFDSIEDDTKRLLKQVHAWDDYGAWGWGGSRNGSIFSSNTVSHRTSAKNFTQLYYTPELETKVRRYYALDYHHQSFHFTNQEVMTTTTTTNATTNTTNHSSIVSSSSPFLGDNENSSKGIV